MDDPVLRQPARAVRSDGAGIVLKRRFEILTDEEHRHFGSPSARTCGARDLLSEEQDVIAIVADPEIPVRAEMLQPLRNYPSGALMRLVDYGIVPWPESDDHRLVMIYDRPAGKRLVPDLSVPFEPMAERSIIDRVISPIADLLALFHAHGLSHRAIRPTNMFTGSDRNSPVVLGECVTVPAGFDQPLAFEPIASQQAMPAGRSPGTVGDDIYALGVSALALFLGADPADGRDPRTLLHDKLARGSYPALAGRHRLPAGLREALRGMLEDNAEQRWGIEDLLAWLNERRLKPMTKMQAGRAHRAFTFLGEQHYEARALAQRIAEHWDEAAFPEHGYELINWARRGLGDEDLAEAIQAAIESGDNARAKDNTTVNPAFTARLCIALDPHAPLRYRNIAVHRDGIGPLLQMHFADANIQRGLGELMVADLASFQARVLSTDEKTVKGQRGFARLSRVVRTPILGYGLERCLYDLNPMAYCRSPLVAAYKIMRIDDLLPGLEKAAAKSTSTSPMDRHVAAFIASRLGVELHSLLEMASDHHGGEASVLGMLGILGTVQVHTGKKPFPKLAQWLAKYTEPAISSFHHNTWREKAKQEIPEIARAGDIMGMYLYLTNGEARQRDHQAFVAAKADYERLNAEIAFLKNPRSRDPRKIAEYGQQISAGLTGVIGIGALVLTLVLSL